MLNVQKLAKTICMRYNIPDAEIDITSMIQNLVLAEINSFANNKNLENFNKTNEQPIITKTQDPNIQRVQVWPRGR